MKPAVGYTTSIPKFNFTSGFFHEVTHLDSFGIAAGFPITERIDKKERKCAPPFDWHGTENETKSNAGAARGLKNSKRKNRKENWQNAESFAYMATGKTIFMSTPHCFANFFSILIIEINFFLVISANISSLTNLEIYAMDVCDIKDIPSLDWR